MKNQECIWKPPDWDRRGGILIIDDDEAIRDVLSFGLREKNFRVWCAADGRTGLKTYWRYREQIDLVLLDVRMPGLDGPQTFVKLRKLTTRVHCCFMSGDLGGYTEQTLIDLGAAAVFRKPILAVELAERLNGIMTDPVLNPSYEEVRKSIRRLPPPRESAPTVTYVARKLDNGLSRTNNRLAPVVSGGQLRLVGND